jgi:hypothetical protein
LLLTWQTPLLQTPLLQTVPQAPQFCGLLAVFTSQPLLGLLSQLRKAPVHADTAHAPLVHAAVALGRLQTLPQAPQFAVLLPLSTSQPLAGLLSQSRNDPVHAWSWQAPPVHTALALAMVQARLHAPQFALLVLVFTSQPLLGLPSQSRKPALHTKEQPPAVQTAAALAGAVQTVPQAPQLRGSVWVLVQLPAHSVRPEAQVARHTPAEQT